MSLPGGRSASWSANMSSNSRNVILPFLTTRCHYWVVDLPGDLPIWALSLEIWKCHSWPQDGSTRGDLPLDGPIWALIVEASSSASMSSNSWNYILPFLATGWLYKGVDLPLDLRIWALTVEASSSASMSSNSWNLILPFLATGWLFQRSRSARWSANMSSNSRSQLISQYDL